MIAAKKKLSPISILMLIAIVAALATWVIPAGQYDKLNYNQNNDFSLKTINGTYSLGAKQKTLDSLGVHINIEKFLKREITKPISIPGTYQRTSKNQQGLIAVIQAPLKGIYDSFDVILFVLVLGGFMNLFNHTGALEIGLAAMAARMKGKEYWLIIISTFLFSLAGSTYGMDAEALMFYPVIVPLFLSAGYDLLVPVAVIFGGTQVGALSSFMNPFSTIIASNAAGINWTNGLGERLCIFVLTTALYIFYLIRYAKRIKHLPSYSFTYNPSASSLWVEEIKPLKPIHSLKRINILLILFFGTFAILIIGVVALDWWVLEMSTLFLISSVILGFITRMDNGDFVEKFIKGSESLLGVGFIVGTARGVTMILNDGKISDTIIFYGAKLSASVPSACFVLLLMLLFIVLNFFISSTSGLAVLTMPIIGSLCILIGISGKEAVNAYLFGTGIMGLITPTGLILPTLSLVNIDLKAWWRFIYPFLIILLLICLVLLISDYFFNHMFNH